MDDLQGILTCSRCRTKHYPEKPKVITKDLYTSKDVEKVRYQLIEEQDFKCKLTQVATAIKDYHTDHAHDDTQLVRGALHKSCNMALGKLENIYTRYLSYWFPHDLSTFLRQAADYIEESEKNPDTRWRHPGWVKKINTAFNQLTEGQKKQILVQLGQPEGKNSKDRKELFRKASLDRQHGFEKLSKIINTVKEQS